jgi:RNA-directed DNA polymerase
VSAVEASPADSRTVVFDRVPLDKVRALQHTLYRTAKADPGRRFHALWDKVLRRDVPWRANGTVIAPGANKPWREKPNAGGERRR